MSEDKELFVPLEYLHQAQDQGGYFEFQEVITAIVDHPKYKEEASVGYCITEGPLMGREPWAPYETNQDYLQFILTLGGTHHFPGEHERYWVIQSWLSEYGGWSVTFHAGAKK
jgi:hypothetical protein